MKATFKIALPLFFIFLSLSSFSQTTNREFGLYLNSFDNYDFIYKKQRGENKFFRIRSLGLKANISKRDVNNDPPRMQLGAGVSVGWEKRRPIADKLSFIHGFEPGVSMSFVRTEPDETVRTTISGNFRLGYILGFNLEASNRLNVSAEIVPAASVSHFSDKTQSGFSSSVNTYAFNMELNGVRIGLAYKFNK